MLIMFFPLFAMESANREGGAFGTQQKSGLLRPHMDYGHGLLDGPKDENPGTTVNVDARRMMDARGANKGDDLSGDRHVESMIRHSDDTVNNPEGPLKIGIKTHTPHDKFFDCIESTAVPQATFYRTLKMNVRYTPYQARVTKQEKQKVCTKQTRCCTGGWRSFFGTRHNDNDPSCNDYQVVTGETRILPYYESCQSLGWRYYSEHVQEITVEVSPEILERTDLISETWEPEDHGLFGCVQRNDCTIINSECVEGPAARPFHTISIHRDCWRQKVTVVGPEETVNSCAGLRKKGCVEVSEQCTKYAKDGRCMTYNKRYRCPASKEEIIDGGQNGIHCIDGGSLVAKPTEFDDMASSLAQLSVLGEMEKELKDTFDPRNVRVFKGQCNRCKKNVWANLLYDCCGTLDGFAVSLSLTSCNAEEKQLAALRADGKCFYVGSMPNKFLGFIDSSDTHFYCCFPSKLVAHLQKEARRQLGKSFGTPHQPDCNGLTMDEITRLDFSKMDLSPLFDDIMKNAKNKTATIDTLNAQQRMQEKVGDLRWRMKP